MKYERIPERLRDSLDRYARDGIPTGDCLGAVLIGDLFGAFGRADPVTTAAMPAIVAYVRNELPLSCYGSEAAVDGWLSFHLERRRREDAERRGEK